MNLLVRFRRPGVEVSSGVSALLRLVALLLLKLPLLAFADSGGLGVGSNLTLIASADGSPAPTFQWQKNGKPIVGATAPTLSFSGIGLADGGTYSVIATNEAGSAVSPDEVIIVDPLPPPPPTTVAPVFVTQPAAFQTAFIGASASLVVAASGTPSPVYQWQKNGIAIAGATNATLTLTALTLNDSATYVAVATNSAGAVTSSAGVLAVTEITVNPPNVSPTITSQPSASQSVAAGGSASFSVTAVGLPAPTYQWKKNGTTILGATNAALALPFVTTSDAANYVVVVSNVAGSVTSNIAALLVTPVTTPTPPPPVPPTSVASAPVITSQPASSQTVLGGASASFTAVAAGNPTPTFQWRKNGSSLAGATNATLSISSVTSADAGVYTVLANNSAGTVLSENSTLIVYTKPIITIQPVPQAVMVGTIAKFSVAVSAIPGATVQWYKNGTPLAGATSSLLMLNSVTSNDVAVYSVVATNNQGTVTSNTASLIIAVPPVITQQPASQTVSAQTNVSFTATASGSPAPSFQWKKNGLKIDGATQGTLTLTNVAKTDAGLYSVDATNVAGWVSSNAANLTVNITANKGVTDGENGGITIPTAPSGETSSANGLVNLSVRATAGAGNDSLIVGFVINGAATKSLLIRGIGPTLRDFGVAGALADPSLALYSGASVTASNDDWSSGDNAAQIIGTSIRVGAFSLADRASDSALMANLEKGAYTVQLSGKNSSSGVGLVEVYDAGSGSATKLVNLSVRAYIGDGSESPNVGFVIAGSTPRRLMVRAVGPGLATFGVPNTIADPKIELFKGNVRINENDNWAGSDALIALFSQVGAFGLPDASSRDAALLVTLEPGAYTVVVSGANGSAGVGLVELYEAP